MQFQQYLQYLVEAKQYRLIDLATKTGINSSDLSRIINGKRNCGSKNLAQILLALDDDAHRSEALTFWLKDQIPVNHRDLVYIVKTTSTAFAKDDVPDIGTLEGAVAVLAAKAEVNAPLRTVLLNMAKAF